MDKHFVLSKIKDYEAHLDNVAPLMESDDQLIMNELIREINNTCHVRFVGSQICVIHTSRVLARVLQSTSIAFIRISYVLPWFSIWSEAKSMHAGE